MFLLENILYGTLHFFGLERLFAVPHYKNFLTVIFSKIFSDPLFFLFFWKPYNHYVSTFNIVLEVSETIHNSFHSFIFILLFNSCFYYSIIQLTYAFFCLFFLLLFFSRVFLISIIFFAWHCLLIIYFF